MLNAPIAQLLIEKRGNRYYMAKKEQQNKIKLRVGDSVETLDGTMSGKVVDVHESLIWIREATQSIMLGFEPQRLKKKKKARS